MVISQHQVWRNEEPGTCPSAIVANILIVDLAAGHDNPRDRAPIAR